MAVHNNDDSVASNFLGTILQEERTEEGGIKMKACEVRAGITREAAVEDRQKAQLCTLLVMSENLDLGHTIQFMPSFVPIYMPVFSCSFVVISCGRSRLVARLSQFSVLVAHKLCLVLWP